MEVIFAPVSPLSPFAPSTPAGPCSPVSPFSPFKFLNANVKAGASVVPLLVTSTLGVPVLASTVAVAVTVGVIPVSPLSPVVP